MIENTLVKIILSLLLLIAFTLFGLQVTKKDKKENK